MDGGGEAGCLGLGVRRRDRVPLPQPVAEPAVEQGHSRVAEVAEHPPDPGARKRAEVARVVHDHMGVVADAEVPRVLGEELGAGQRVGELRRGVDALVDVEEARARNVRLRKLPFAVPLHLRQVPGGVQDPQTRAHLVAAHHVREPFRRDEVFSPCSHVHFAHCVLSTFQRPPTGGPCVQWTYI